jgi:hypothetical protein
VQAKQRVSVPRRWFSRLLRMRCAIYRCPRRLDGQSWPTTAWNPRNVGSIMSSTSRRIPG